MSLVMNHYGRGRAEPRADRFYFILHLLYDVMVIPLRGAGLRRCE
jgi:hypothetical protein